MRIRPLAWYLMLGISAAATFGQDSHLNRDVEIPLDDFPVMIIGYRIQIGAYKTEQKALGLMFNLNSKFSQSAHLQFADGLWRVRLGDFRDSLECRDFIQNQIIPAGYGEAIMVADKLPGDPELLPRPETEDGYRIQIASLSDRDSAIARAKNVACNFPDLRPHVVWTDSLYKVQFGDFRSDSAAAAWQTELKQVDSLKAIVVPAQVYGPVPPPPSQKTPEKDIFQYDD